MYTEKEMVISMYSNTVAPNKIAAILNIKQSKVFDILKENNILLSQDRFNKRDSKVCEMYNDSKKITEIANVLRINRHTVTDILKRKGIYKGNVRASNLSSEKIERNKKIIELYEQGLSLRQVSEKIGVSPSTVNVVMKTFNKDLREPHQKGHSSGTTKNRKHFFNFDFFETIDTEEKAYWLGFLYADGCVSDRNGISLVLQKKDKEHIELFLKNIGANTVKIRENKKTNSCRVSLCSVKLATDLFLKGCVQRKSLKLTFPSFDIVPEALIHHFMRGYFDGDGCIYINKNNKYSSTFSVLGTKRFLDGYEKILISNIDTCKETKRVHEDTWNVNTECIAKGGRKQCIAIYEFLYKDATIFLNRKKDKFESLYRRLETKSQESQEDNSGIKRESRKDESQITRTEGADKLVG